MARWVTDKYENLKVSEHYQPQFRSRQNSKVVETKRLFGGEGKLCILFRFMSPRVARVNWKKAVAQFNDGRGIHIIGQARDVHYNQRHVVSRASQRCYDNALAQWLVKYGKSPPSLPSSAMEDYTIVYYRKSYADKRNVYDFKTVKVKGKRYNVTYKREKGKKFKKISNVKYKPIPKKKSSLDTELDRRDTYFSSKGF